MVGFALLFAGFVAGLVCSRHLKNSVPDVGRKAYLAQKGDAPPDVRNGVLAAFRDFQDGYSHRDPKQLESFMGRLFPDGDDVLLLGADYGEWIRGRNRVSRFIQSDWERWGDVKLSVEEATVWSSGDAAWLATTGTVDSPLPRPLRFSAVLTRHGQSWLFRQVQFQWDESDARVSDLFRWRNLSELLSWAVHFAAHGSLR